MPKEKGNLLKLSGNYLIFYCIKVSMGLLVVNGALKKEWADLQHRIDESLKAVENGETLEEPNPQMPDEINDLERA